MTNSKTKAAGRVLAVLMVITLLFAANCAVLSVSADTLGTTIYLKTTKTTTPYLHYWNNTTKVGSSWPGVAMTSEGDNIYSYELPCDVGELEGVIFKKDGGSGDDSKLTQDVTNITGNLYDLDAGTWGTYDTSSIKITSAGADLESPQYTGSKVTLAVMAEGGDGKLQYKISANDTVLSDFSGKNTVVWEPTKEGDYTILFEVKDGSGETNKRQLSYTVKSSENAEEPIFLSASPANGAKVKKDSAVTVDVKGAGGHVNNDILFYKTEVTDPNGNVVNTAYYQTGSKITFTPSVVGEYTVTMSIQNNTVKNTTRTVSYTYVSTTEEIDTQSDVIDTQSDVIDTQSDVIDTQSDVIDTQSDVIDTESDVIDTQSDVIDTQTDVDTQSDVNTESDKETDTEKKDTDTDEPVVFVLGDINKSGKVELRDAYTIQGCVLGKKTLTAEEIERADVNGDGRVTLKDASIIQQYMAGLRELK